MDGNDGTAGATVALTHCTLTSEDEIITDNQTSEKMTWNSVISQGASAVDVSDKHIGVEPSILTEVEIDRAVNSGVQSYKGKLSPSHIEDNWSTVGGTAASRDSSEVGSSHLSTISPGIDLSYGSSLRGKKSSPDRNIPDLIHDDTQCDEGKVEGVDQVKPNMQVSSAHEILNSYIAMNPSSDRVEDSDASLVTLRNSAKSGVPIKGMGDDEMPNDQPQKQSTSYRKKPVLNVITSAVSQDFEKTLHKSSAKNGSQTSDCASPASLSKIYNKQKLNERLRRRMAHRNHRIRKSSTDEKSSTEKESLECNETVMPRRTFGKCSSETGISPPSRKIPPSHGIGILQPDGIVFDDALLRRLARQARYSRLRGDHRNAISGASSSNFERRLNSVKIHVYDLVQRDTLVEMPYLNCNFPIGQCFKMVNNAANCLGTGAYHVGVEVNGIEYAFGANNIIGMSGVFTCPPKHSPGYEYRETLDFGNIYTTKKTWIRVPKENALGKSINNRIVSLRDILQTEEQDNTHTSTKSTGNYTFRQIESFADGNAIIHSMAKEYMGTDYDLLRKNCCTFAHDVCLRLGVKEEDVPKWFHNAAQAGADAEDAITNAEQTVKSVFDCSVEDGDTIDIMEGYNHGFEVIADLKQGSTELKVVESPPVYKDLPGSQPLPDDPSEAWETLSWTY